MCLCLSPYQSCCGSSLVLEWLRHLEHEQSAFPVPTELGRCATPRLPSPPAWLPLVNGTNIRPES